MFRLPDDKRVLTAARALAWRLESGRVPSIDDFKSRIRLRGRGQRFGHAASGKLRNLDYTQTVVKRELRFRDDRTAPRRRIKLLVDLSASDESASSAQLAGISLVVTCSLLSLPGTSVTLQPFGARNTVRERVYFSISDYRAVRENLKRCFRMPTDPHLVPGKLRFAMGDVDEYHFVLITHYIDPAHLAALSCPLGLSSVLVEPVTGSVLGGGSGFFGGRFGAAGNAVIYDEIQSKYDHYAGSTRRRLGPTLHVRGDALPVAALSDALLKQKQISSAARARVPAQRKPIESLVEYVRNRLAN